MKISIGAVILAAALAFGGPAATASAVAPSKAGVHAVGPPAPQKATDFSARRHYRRYDRYGYRPYYRPNYYARPYYYRPYPYDAPAPFPLGFGFGPWWW